MKQPGAAFIIEITIAERGIERSNLALYWLVAYDPLPAIRLNAGSSSRKNI